MTDQQEPRATVRISEAPNLAAVLAPLREEDEHKTLVMTTLSTEANEMPGSARPSTMADQAVPHRA